MLGFSHPNAIGIIGIQRFIETDNKKNSQKPRLDQKEKVL